MRRKWSGIVGMLVTSVVLLSDVVAATPPLQFGEGLAVIDVYDQQRKTLVTGAREVRLLPDAARSLDEQLATQRWTVGKPFGASFNVMRGPDGQPAIGSIYVFPPRNR